MGKTWDGTGVAFNSATWREALRVLKPGGHLLAFGGTRTYHRMATAVEDAGFEIRDQIVWLYGSGFPKSRDVSKAIDAHFGKEREVVGQRTDGRYASGFSEKAKKALGGVVAAENESGFSGEMGLVTKPATPEAERWEGWGTALKPAMEPIVVARKPLEGTVAENVLRYGTGAVNVEACRIGENKNVPASPSQHDSEICYGSYGVGEGRMGSGFDANVGRWPANVVIDQRVESCIAVMGEASRFFYCAKASRSERNAGLADFPLQLAYTHNIDGRDVAKPTNAMGGGERLRVERGELGIALSRNLHPTVKPIDLMRWLVRLVTRPGGTVLDPFAGSGTTGVAAVLEGFDFVGIEKELEYSRIAKARISFWATHPTDLPIERALEAERGREKARDAGQDALF